MKTTSAAGKTYDYGDKYSDPDRGKDLRKKPGDKPWSVSDMWEIHHEIARLILLGWKNVNIAKKLNCSAQMISNVRNSAVVQDRLEIMKGARDADTIDLSREIRDIAPTALELLKDVIDGDVGGEKPNIGLRAKAAESMMDRAGYAAPKRIQSESISMTLTIEEIEDLKKRAFKNDDIVEGEFEES